MFAVIRLRGIVKAREEIGYVLNILKLRRKMHCILVKRDESTRGMLN